MIPAPELTDTVGFVMDFEGGDISPARLVQGFAHLVRTGDAYRLQGFYGRTAEALIERGLIDRAGNWDPDRLDELAEGGPA